MISQKELYTSELPRAINDEASRAYHTRSKAIQFDVSSLTAHIECDFKMLGDSSEASSFLHVRGRPTTLELRRRLARRSHSGNLLRRDTVETGIQLFTFDLGNNGWSSNEPLVSDDDG